MYLMLDSNMKPPDNKLKRRIVVIEQIHCTSGKNMPATVESRYYRFLESDDEPYVRLVTLVDSDPIELNYAWIDTPSVLHINNVGKTVVNVVLGGGHWLVLPGESMRGTPCGKVSLVGPGTVEVGAFPQ